MHGTLGSEKEKTKTKQNGLWEENTQPFSGGRHPEQCYWAEPLTDQTSETLSHLTVYPTGEALAKQEGLVVAGMSAKQRKPHRWEFEEMPQ